MILDLEIYFDEIARCTQPPTSNVGVKDPLDGRPEIRRPLRQPAPGVDKERGRA